MQKGGKTPFQAYESMKKEGLTKDDVFHLFVSYNRSLATQGKCYDTNKQKTVECDCLCILDSEHDREDAGEIGLPYQAIAEWQMDFASQDKLSQQREIIHMIRYGMGPPRTRSRDTHKKYSIPFLAVHDGTEEGHIDHNQRMLVIMEAWICKHALQALIGYRYHAWKTVLDCAEDRMLPTHKLKGLESNNKRKWEELYATSLIHHFEQLKQEAGPIATRTVRELGGQVTERDNNDLYEYLPSSLSKRNCYEKYCYSLGVKIKVNNRGNIVSRVAVDPDASLLKIPSIPSWKAYLNYWTKHYPNLKVSRPSEDVCNYCYAFVNIYKSLCRRPYLPQYDFCLPVSSELLQEDQVRVGNLLLPPNDQHQHEADVLTAYVPDAITQEREEKIAEANLHVRMAKVQRELVNRKIALARETRDYDHSDRTYTFIVDYGQNMELPMFGHEQPGDTYYFSPLTIYNLGVVDVSHPEGDHLYCHIYKEGDGKKGGNNVSSLLMKTLQFLSLLKDSAGKELNVVFDNCGGQNKNNFVLLLIPFLVELGYFKHVNFIFLIVGHTKNAADRLFNALKHVYRRSNVQTFRQLLRVCGTSPHVTSVAVIDGDFSKYSEFLSQFYVTLKDLKSQHIFSCSVQSNGAIYNTEGELHFAVRKSDLDEHLSISKDFIKGRGIKGRADNAVRRSAMEKCLLEPIPFQGIPEFKQVELYTKYLKHIDPEHQGDDLYRKPPDEVFERQKIDKGERKQVKDDRKRKRHVP
jgi:hypothetical protein